MSDNTPKIIREFRAYHTLNPKVYGLFKEKTFNLINLGKTRGMALGILYNIRWEVDFAVREDFKFKLANSCATGYSRLFEIEFPRHAGFFATKKSVFDDYDLTDLLVQPLTTSNV